MQYPYAVNVYNVGSGTMEPSVARAIPGQTVTLTVKSGTLGNVSAMKAGGGIVSVSGNETDGYYFTMPNRDVNVMAAFSFDNGAIPLTSTQTTLENGKKYRVIENTGLASRITVNGTATLILGEGTTLYAYDGIELSSDNSANLTIEGAGTLTISNPANNKSGIGAEKVGTLTINGGTINVTGGYKAAGIGGDKNNTVGGTITIKGGVVNATGGTYAAGFGGGYNDDEKNKPEYGVCGNIVINGGQVTAVSGDNRTPGIGPSHSHVLESNVTNSGTLTLGWINPDDFVSIGRPWNNDLFNYVARVASITFALGRQFVLEGEMTFATAANIEGNTIVPYFTLSGAGNEDSPYKDNLDNLEQHYYRVII